MKTTCASEGSGDPLLVVSDGGVRDHPGDRGMLPPDRRASVASHTGCAISWPRSRRIHGRNSRPGSQPAIRAPSRAIARQLATGIRADYANVLPSALACFEDDFESCIALTCGLPVTHRRFVRTTNLLGRLFVEERRRLKIIPGEWLRRGSRCSSSCSERSSGPPNVGADGLRFTEFELRPDRRSQEGP